MGDEEGMSNSEFGNGGILRRMKREAMTNGPDIASGNDSVDGSLGGSEGFRFYKRRKHARSSSESKGLEDGIGSAGAASKLAEQTGKELPSHLYENNSALHGMNEVSPSQWRKFVLTHMYLSLSDDEGGIGECMRDALKAKGSNSCDGGRHKSSLWTGCRANGSQAAANEEMSTKPNGVLEESHHKVNEMCRHSLFKVLQSQDFTSLCKLIFENFQGMNADNLFGLRLIDKRMKEGIYGRSPMLFSADIQQLWLKLQKVGTELMSLAKSLADMSMSCYSEQFGGAVNCTSEVGRDEFGTRESVSHGKPEQMESCIYRVCICRTCGDKADGRDCLVCDSCEEMYHISCIKPAVKEIPPKSWYCANCIEGAMGSAHENCAVCERLNVPRTHFHQAGDEINPTDEETVNEPEDISNDSTADGVHVSQNSKKRAYCKICTNVVENGGCKICEHPYCPNKYYHERCLTPKQLTCYGPRWYCPSCLCRACLTDKDDDKILLCDSCDHAYHIYCLDPPRAFIPRGKWFCNRCQVKIQEIRRVKRAYLKLEKALKKKVEEAKMANENPTKKSCAEATDSDKAKDGMNMLAFAALKCEVGCLSNEELKSL